MAILKGEVVGILPDLKAMKGSVAMKRLDDNKFEIHFKGTADGEALSDVATATRKKQE